MLEDDKVLINRVYHEFDKGQVTTVPEWAGRSLIDKGTAKPVEDDDPTDEERFANPEQRQTKVPQEVLSAEVVTPVTAEPTSEDSSWYQFRGAEGSLLEVDGETHKVLGTDERNAILDALNDG